MVLESLGTVSYSPFIVTMAVSLAISETFSVTLKSGFGLVRGHLKSRISIDHV